MTISCSTLTQNDLVRFGCLVQDSEVGAVPGIDPLGDPDRDWYAVGSMGFWGPTGTAGSAATTFENRWDFRSKRKITDIKRSPVLLLASTVNAFNFQLTVDTLLAIP